MKQPDGNFQHLRARHRDEVDLHFIAGHQSELAERVPGLEPEQFLRPPTLARCGRDQFAFEHDTEKARIIPAVRDRFAGFDRHHAPVGCELRQSLSRRSPETE